MKVLVVEDDPDIQVILRMVLTRMGKCEVVLTDRGAETLSLAKEHSPDFILLDVMLPEMSGYDICKVLKAETVTQGIPIIFLTARSMPDDIKAALGLGALGFLTKPFDPMTLVSQIDVLLSPIGITIGKV